MSDWIIKAEGLSKRYRIRHQQPGRQYKALRDVLTEKAMGLFRKMGERRAESGSAIPSPLSSLPSSAPSVEDFWALRDVSFEIKPGEVVGIIGRNGAGKSTLLKVLSRITEPTEGQITLRGRVASLLEVGTGFHPELTGRENIFLNGAILGMSRAEIRRKFDEIVAFAEVERFLDTPVKRYSSGMYVRLAFAVAAHLEPEILVVDEVLAVGDAEFQKKCLGKMQDVAGHGRTVLFVSHNMAAVRRLCGRGILMGKGQIVAAGDINQVVDAYLTGSNQFGEFSRQEFGANPDSERPAFSSIEIRNSKGEMRNTILSGEPFEIAITLHNPREKEVAAIIGVEVLDGEGVSLFTSHSDDVSGELACLPPGKFAATCTFKMNPLMPGNYNLQLGLVDRQWSLLDFVRVDLPLRIEDVPHAKFGMNLRRPGRLALEIPWRFG